MIGQRCLVCEGSIEHVPLGEWTLCSDTCTRAHVGQLKLENHELKQRIVSLLAELALEGELHPAEIPDDFGPED